MGFSVYSATKVYSSNVYVTLAQSGKFLISGSAHATYGQPSASAALEPRKSEFASRRVWA